MRKCENCGRNLQEAWRFCGQCGSPQTDVAPGVGVREAQGAEARDRASPPQPARPSSATIAQPGDGPNATAQLGENLPVPATRPIGARLDTGHPAPRPAGERPGPVPSRGRRGRPTDHADVPRATASEDEHDTTQYLELTRKLDILATKQLEAIRAVEKLSEQQERMQPTKRTSTAAILIFLLSIALIVIAFNRIALATSQTDTLHAQAQAERSLAIEELAGAIASGRAYTYSAVMTIAADQLHQADSIDAQADALGAGLSLELYIVQILLVIGSAIAGGAISWAMTQFLINKRRRRRTHADYTAACVE